MRTAKVGGSMFQFSVGRSIAQAYGFFFRRILTVITVSWIAALFFIGLRKALLGLAPFPQDVLGQWPLALEHVAGLMAAVLIVCAIAVPLARSALGEAGDWALAHFFIGARELRLFAALVQIYVIVIALIALSAGAVVGTQIGVKAALAHWPQLAATGLPVCKIACVAVEVLAALITIYASVRLSFLIYAVAGAEDRASLRRSWELARGNVLRMFLVVLAIAVPVYVAFSAALYAFMGQPLVEAVQVLVMSHGVTATPLHVLLATHGWTVAEASAVLVVVMTSLSAAASASGYRSILGLDPAPAAAEDAVLLEDVVEPMPAPDHGEAAAHHEAEAHAEHGHDEQGHEEHGHEEAGHGDHGHEAHAPENHGDADHAHEVPGHDDHGHDAHGDASHEHDHHEHDHHAAADDHGEAAHGDEHHGEASQSAADGHGAADAHEPGIHDAAAHDEAAHGEVSHDEAGHDEAHRALEHA